MIVYDRIIMYDSFELSIHNLFFIFFSFEKYGIKTEHKSLGTKALC